MCLISQPYRSSAIFNAKQQALRTIETKAIEQQDPDASDKEQDDDSAEAATVGRDKVDLTLEQSKIDDEDGLDEMDDFDLLDATIDPTDVKSLKRKIQLEEEIEYEQVKIKSKLLWKIALGEDNPLRIDEWF